MFLLLLSNKFAKPCITTNMFRNNRQIWCLRFLSNNSDLSNIIGPYAAQSANPLVTKNLTNFFYVLTISIAIFWYLESKFNYGQLIGCFSLGSYNGTNNSSYLDQY